MALPGVNITVQDGALGIIQPSVANVQLKIGSCSGATASVAAAKKLASTTGGDGVTYTAVTPGTGGNQISVTVASPTGGSTTVSVVGNAITVHPMSSEINSGIVTAISGSAPASALVTAVATGPSDDVVAVSKTFLVGGTNGTEYTIFPETNPTQALTDLGRGPLLEAVVHSLNVAGGLVYAMPVIASTAGVAGSVTQAGSGTATLVVTGNPYDDYSVVIEVVQGGAPGSAIGRLSLDGGENFGPNYVLNTPGLPVANTGLTNTFSGSGSGAFVTGDTYQYLCTQPILSQSDITTALAAAVALSQYTWGWVHCVGPADNVTDSASIAVAVEAVMESLASTYFRYAFAVIEVPQDTDANILAAFAAVNTPRVMCCAGFENLTSSVSGGAPDYNRNAAFPVTARMALVPAAQSLGRVATGSLPGVNSLVRDEFVTPALDAVGFTTLRTLTGAPGFYITRGHMFVPPTSDFTRSQNRRVMDVACASTLQSLLHFLEETLDVQATGANAGALTDQEAANISSYCTAGLKSLLLATNQATAASVVALQTNDVLTDSTVYVQTRITPKGYAETINENIAFFNPGLQVQAAT